MVLMLLLRRQYNYYTVAVPAGGESDAALWRRSVSWSLGGGWLTVRRQGYDDA